MEYKHSFDGIDKDISNKAALWLLTIIIASFIAIHSFNLNLSISDENTYFYMGNLITQGFLPYKDFFYAHPPLNIFIIALLIKLFGMNFIVLKLLPVITTAISALLIYLIAKNLHSRLSAIIAVILFLFAYETLRVSSYLIGIDIATMFILFSLYFLFKENKNNKSYLYAGIFIGIAAISTLNSLIAAFVISIILLFKSRKSLIYFILGFSSIFLTINIALILLYGQSYITPVIKYHFLKPVTESSFKIIFNILVKENWLLVISALLLIFAKGRKRVSALAIIALAYLIFLITYKSLFGYYLFLILPLLAVIGSYSIFSLIDKFANANNNKEFNLKFDPRTALIALFVIIGIASALSINRYLNYEFQDFNNAQEIASYIKANSNPETALFGDDSITPLLALLSERKIAFSHADLNNFRWRTGLVDIQETINSIKAEKPIIATFQVNIPQGTFRYGIDYLDEFHYFLDEECTVIKEFKDTWLDYEKVVRLWDC